MIICLILLGIGLAWLMFVTVIEINYHHADREYDKYYDFVYYHDNPPKEEKEEYYNKLEYYTASRNKWYDLHHVFAFDGGLSFLWIVLILVILLFTILPISIQQGMSSIDYDKWTARKEALELDYQDYLSKEIYDTTDIHQRINDFNWELHMNKFWASNPWTSWYNNQKLLDIEPIEVHRK